METVGNLSGQGKKFPGNQDHITRHIEGDFRDFFTNLFGDFAQDLNDCFGLGSSNNSYQAGFAPFSRFTGQDRI